MERRLAAILAADVVGYAHLMGRDEAGTFARLVDLRQRLLEPLITEHHGRIVKLMGDGLLVEFASVVDAVTCALVWQEAVERHEFDSVSQAQLRFRIGINLGDVIVEGDDIHGDGVNIAARLEGLAEPGGICVSGDAYRQVRGKVEANFEDLGSTRLKNIAESVRVYRLGGGTKASAGKLREDTTAKSTSFAPRLTSILLSPFRHLGTSDEAEALASGLTETLAAALAHFEEFELIDPGSAGQAIAAGGALEAAKSLGARYILEGSVQVALQRARIGVQLVEVASGQRVWSETLDRGLDDVFALQDDITAFVASTMGDAVGEEQAKAISQKPNSDLSFGELLVRGIQHLHRGNYEDNETARAIFEQVREADPEGFFPTLCLCWTYAVELGSGWPTSRPDALEYSLDVMRDLMRRYPRSAHAHRLISRLLFFNGGHEHGLAHAKRACELNPYHSDMMIALGMALLWNGDLDDAIVQLERAFAINPYAPEAFKQYLSLAYFLVDRHEEGFQVLSSSEVRASTSSLYRVLNLVGLKRIAEAKEQAQILSKDNPTFELKDMLIVRSFKREEDRERINAALHEAGLSE